MKILILTLLPFSLFLSAYAQTWSDTILSNFRDGCSLYDSSPVRRSIENLNVVRDTLNTLAAAEEDNSACQQALNSLHSTMSPLMSLPSFTPASAPSVNNSSTDSSSSKPPKTNAQIGLEISELKSIKDEISTENVDSSTVDQIDSRLEELNREILGSDISASLNIEQQRRRILTETMDPLVAGIQAAATSCQEDGQIIPSLISPITNISGAISGITGPNAQILQATGGIVGTIVGGLVQGFRGRQGRRALRRIDDTVGPMAMFCASEKLTDRFCSSRRAVILQNRKTLTESEPQRCYAGENLSVFELFSHTNSISNLLSYFGGDDENLNDRELSVGQDNLLRYDNFVQSVAPRLRDSLNSSYDGAVLRRQREIFDERLARVSNAASLIRNYSNENSALTTEQLSSRLREIYPLDNSSISVENDLRFFLQKNRDYLRSRFEELPTTSINKAPIRQRGLELLSEWSLRASQLPEQRRLDMEQLTAMEVSMDHDMSTLNTFGDYVTSTNFSRLFNSVKNRQEAEYRDFLRNRNSTDSTLYQSQADAAFTGVVNMCKASLAFYRDEIPRRIKSKCSENNERINGRSWEQILNLPWTERVCLISDQRRLQNLLN